MSIRVAKTGFESMMISDELGIQLHDRWTRGQKLTAEEQMQLEAWYQQQDAAQAQLPNHVSATTEIPELQAQIEMVLAQLSAAIGRVQQVTTENEVLRREISLLQQQLVASKSA